MRPTGALHLGHYHGALKNWVRLQHEYECFFFVADWHALTTHYEEPGVIEQNVCDMVIDWLAAGIDPAHATLFIQSQVPEHAELHLLLSMITPLRLAGARADLQGPAGKARGQGSRHLRLPRLPAAAGADILIYRADLGAGRRGPGCRTSSSRARSRGASTICTAASRASRRRRRRPYARWAASVQGCTKNCAPRFRRRATTRRWKPAAPC